MKFPKSREEPQCKKGARQLVRIPCYSASMRPDSMDDFFANTSILASFVILNNDMSSKSEHYIPNCCKYTVHNVYTDQHVELIGSFPIYIICSSLQLNKREMTNTRKLGELIAFEAHRSKIYMSIVIA